MKKNGFGKFSKFLRSAVAVASAAVMCVSLAGCSVEFGTNPKAKDKKIVAKPTAGDDTKGMEITYLDFRKQYDYILDFYGIEDDTDEDIAEACTEQRNEIIENLITTRVIVHEAQKLGITLTQEELDEAQKTTDTQINQQIEYFSGLADYSDLSTEEITDDVRRERGEAEFDKFLENCGITREDMLTWSQEYIISTKLLDEVTKDITREQAEAETQEFIAKVKTLYEEDTYTYESGEYYNLWVPEGSRLIKHILLGFDESLQAEITIFRNGGNNEEADRLRAEGAAELEEKTAEVQQKLDEMNKGEITFEKILLDYSDDSAASSMYPDGYVVVPNSVMLMPEFRDAAFVPEKIGDRTVCVTDYGVHVMIYAGDAKANQDTIDAFTDTAYGEMRSASFQTKLDEWKNAYNYEIDRELLRLDYKPETSDGASDSSDTSDYSDDSTDSVN